jgi:hypothetical protein
MDALSTLRRDPPNARRQANCEGSRRHVTGDDRPGANQRIFANLDASDHDSAASDCRTPAHTNPLHGPFARDQAAVGGGRPRQAIVDEDYSMPDENLVLNLDSVTDKCVALNLATLADLHPALNLDERADLGLVADRAAVEIHESEELDVPA